MSREARENPQANRCGCWQVTQNGEGHKCHLLEKKFASVCIFVCSSVCALVCSYVKKKASINVAQDVLYHRKKCWPTVK